MIWFYIVSAIFYGIAFWLCKEATFIKHYANIQEKIPIRVWVVLLLSIAFVIPIINVATSAIICFAIICSVCTRNGDEFDEVILFNKHAKLTNFLKKNLNA